MLFKWLWKPVFIIDSDAGSLRLADVWMLQVDTWQDLTDTCQDPNCSACHSKITAFVAQHCSSDASSFRDFSFLSPVPQRYICCQSVLFLSSLSHLCSPGYLGQLSFSCFSSLSDFKKVPLEIISSFLYLQIISFTTLLLFWNCFSYVSGVFYSYT